MEKKLKIAVFCAEGLDEFIQPMIQEWSKQHDVRLANGRNPEQTSDNVIWADVVWLEWGNELAITLTRAAKVLDNTHTILRVHSYEIFAGFMHQIRWEAVDQLVCPSQYTLDLVMHSADMAGNYHRIKKHVIPTGIDIEQFPFKEREHGNKIAFVARLNHKKGIPLLIQAAMELPDYDFHIAGEWQDSRFKLYADHMIREAKLSNVHFHGWIGHDEMPAWLADKNYILTTSPFESQGVGIMEAMAMGIMPIVHNFPGAAELYPGTCLWNSVAELDLHAHDMYYDSHAYRAHIEKRFSKSHMIIAMNALLPSLDHLDSAKSGDQKSERDGQAGVDLTKTARLAVCFMYDNEEHNLKRCLDSVKPFADVVVAMDTGSTDGSNDILKSYGIQPFVPIDLDQLFTETDYGKKLMFGPARNRLLKSVPDDVDWIMMIDCDEEFCSEVRPEAFKRFLGNLKETWHAVAVNMKDMQGGQVAMDFNSVKFFRKGQVHYKNIVHNEPVFQGQAALYSQAHFKHYGYDLDEAGKKRKLERTIGLLDRRIVNNPRDWKAYFYKGQALGFYNPDDHENIIANTKIYVDHRNEINDFNLSAYFTLIRALMRHGDMDEAFEKIKEARMLLPDDLDIAMAMIEFGVHTRNHQMISAGSNEFIRIWDVYQKDPSKKGGRFQYSHNMDALAFAFFYKTSTQFQAGMNDLSMFQNVLQQLPKERKKELALDMDRALAMTGVGLTVPTDGGKNKTTH